MILNDYYGVEDEIKNQVKLCLVWIIVSACHNNIIKQYFSLEGWYFFLFFSLKERKHKQFYYYSFITIKQHSYWLQIKEQGVQIIMSVMTKNCLTVVARKRQLSNYRHFFLIITLLSHNQCSIHHAGSTASLFLDNTLLVDHSMNNGEM